MNLAIGATCLYLAAGLAYGTTGVNQFAKIVVLAIAVAAIVLGYRFLPFRITLYGT
ncbi:MAG: hypothetical protein AB7P31_08230 [Steroidobacteraceae bacterium]